MTEGHELEREIGHSIAPWQRVTNLKRDWAQHRAMTQHSAMTEGHESKERLSTA